VGRCVVEGRQKTQCGGRREYSAKANDKYTGSLINNNSKVTKLQVLKK